MKLALVVPALNEEDAIADTLRRALAARRAVVQRTSVTEMVIVFVNDGSTDRTQEIVDQPEFNDVLKVQFAENQGYGTAIKHGWSVVDADLLGFIDADGTCDPEVCADLVNRLERTQADVVLAARLTPESKMPWVRKVGNMIFARLLGLVSGQQLTDSASGFRIVRRSSLKYMSPLPDGLHFTPAMSAICVLDPRLRIEEVPFAYQERVGRSKLSVVKDGIRFLYVIIFTACCYNPIKTMLGVGALVLLFSGLLAAVNARLTDSVLPSLAVVGVWSMTVVLLLTGGVICHQLNYLLLGPRQKMSVFEQAVHSTLHHWRLVFIGLAAMCMGMVGLATLPWMGWGSTAGLVAAVTLAAIFVVGGTVVTLVGIVTRIIWNVNEKQKALLDEDYLVSSSKVESAARVSLTRPVSN